MQIHGRAVQAASQRTRAGARQVMHDRFQQVQGTHVNIYLFIYLYNYCT